MSVDLVVKNAKLVSPRGIIEAGVAVNNGKIISVSRDINLPKGNINIDIAGKYVLPGLLDGHAHTFLPPETPETGMKAAAKGGITWQYCRPPLDVLDYEMDVRSVALERIH